MPSTIIALLLSLSSTLTAQPTETGHFSTGPLNYTSVIAQLSAQKVDITPFIIGGNAALVGEFPWMTLLVGLQNNGVILSICGGVLIRRDWVLSALRCIQDEDGTPIAPRFTAFMGVTDLGNFVLENFVFEGETYRPEYVEFEDFYSLGVDNVDLVIMKLATPSALPHLDIPMEDTSASHGIVAGWGVDEEGVSSTVLQFLDDVPLLPDSSCSLFEATHDLTYYRCAGYLEGIDGPCTGDSGGPLIAPNPAAKHGFDLIGIAAVTATSCAEPGSAEIYTDLVPLKDWVDAVAGPPTTQPRVDPTPSPAPLHTCACSCSCTNGFEYEYEHNHSGSTCT